VKSRIWVKYLRINEHDITIQKKFIVMGIIIQRGISVEMLKTS